MQSATEHFILESREECSIIHFDFGRSLNRLTLARVQSLTTLMEELAEAAAAKTNGKPRIITGNDESFSAGADLNEIDALSSTNALEFAFHHGACLERIRGEPGRPGLSAGPRLVKITAYLMQ